MQGGRTIGGSTENTQAFPSFLFVDDELGHGGGLGGRKSDEGETVPSGVDNSE